MTKYLVVRVFVVFLPVLFMLACSRGGAPGPETGDIIVNNKDDARFLLVNSPLTVIDTHTGQVWSVGRTKDGDHRFERICYLASDGKSLMPTPYEEEFVKDLTRYQKMCNP